MFLKVQCVSLVENELGFNLPDIAKHLIGNAEIKKKKKKKGLMYAVDSNNVTVLLRCFYELVLV